MSRPQSTSSTRNTSSLTGCSIIKEDTDSNCSSSASKMFSTRAVVVNHHDRRHHNSNDNTDNNNDNFNSYSYLQPKKPSSATPSQVRSLCSSADDWKAPSAVGIRPGVSLFEEYPVASFQCEVMHNWPSRGNTSSSASASSCVYKGLSADIDVSSLQSNIHSLRQDHELFLESLKNISIISSSSSSGGIVSSQTKRAITATTTTASSFPLPRPPQTTNQIKQNNRFTPNSDLLPFNDIKISQQQQQQKDQDQRERERRGNSPSSSSVASNPSNTSSSGSRPGTSSKQSNNNNNLLPKVPTTTRIQKTEGISSARAMSASNRLHEQRTNSSSQSARRLNTTTNTSSFTGNTNNNNTNTNDTNNSEQQQLQLDSILFQNEKHIKSLLRNLPPVVKKLKKQCPGAAATVATKLLSTAKVLPIACDRISSNEFDHWLSNRLASETEQEFVAPLRELIAQVAEVTEQMRREAVSHEDWRDETAIAVRDKILPLTTNIGKQVENLKTQPNKQLAIVKSRFQFTHQRHGELSSEAMKVQSFKDSLRELTTRRAEVDRDVLTLKSQVHRFHENYGQKTRSFLKLKSAHDTAQENLSDAKLELEDTVRRDKEAISNISSLEEEIETLKVALEEGKSEFEQEKIKLEVATPESFCSIGRGGRMTPRPEFVSQQLHQDQFHNVVSGGLNKKSLENLLSDHQTNNSNNNNNKNNSMKNEETKKEEISELQQQQQESEEEKKDSSVDVNNDTSSISNNSNSSCNNNNDNANTTTNNNNNTDDSNNNKNELLFQKRKRNIIIPTEFHQVDLRSNLELVPEEEMEQNQTSPMKMNLVVVAVAVAATTSNDNDSSSEKLGEEEKEKRRQQQQQQQRSEQHPKMLHILFAPWTKHTTNAMLQLLAQNLHTLQEVASFQSAQLLSYKEHRTSFLKLPFGGGFVGSLLNQLGVIEGGAVGTLSSILNLASASSATSSTSPSSHSTQRRSLSPQSASSSSSKRKSSAGCDTHGGGSSSSNNNLASGQFIHILPNLSGDRSSSVLVSGSGGGTSSFSSSSAATFFSVVGSRPPQPISASNIFSSGSGGSNIYSAVQSSGYGFGVATKSKTDSNTSSFDNMLLDGGGDNFLRTQFPTPIELPPRLLQHYLDSLCVAVETFRKLNLSLFSGWSTSTSGSPSITPVILKLLALGAANNSNNNNFLDMRSKSEQRESVVKSVSNVVSTTNYLEKQQSMKNIKQEQQHEQQQQQHDHNKLNTSPSSSGFVSSMLASSCRNISHPTIIPSTDTNNTTTIAAGNLKKQKSFSKTGGTSSSSSSSTSMMLQRQQSSSSFFPKHSKNQQQNQQQQDVVSLQELLKQKSEAVANLLLPSRLFSTHVVDNYNKLVFHEASIPTVDEFPSWFFDAVLKSHTTTEGPVTLKNNPSLYCKQLTLSGLLPFSMIRQHNDVIRRLRQHCESEAKDCEVVSTGATKQFETLFRSVAAKQCLRRVFLECNLPLQYLPSLVACLPRRLTMTPADVVSSCSGAFYRILHHVQVRLVAILLNKLQDAVVEIIPQKSSSSSHSSTLYSQQQSGGVGASSSSSSRGMSASMSRRRGGGDNSNIHTNNNSPSFSFAGFPAVLPSTYFVSMSKIRKILVETMGPIFVTNLHSSGLLPYTKPLCLSTSTDTITGGGGTSSANESASSSTLSSNNEEIALSVMIRSALQMAPSVRPQRRWSPGQGGSLRGTAYEQSIKIVKQSGGDIVLNQQHQHQGGGRSSSRTRSLSITSQTNNTNTNTNRTLNRTHSNISTATSVGGISSASQQQLQQQRRAPSAGGASTNSDDSETTSSHGGSSVVSGVTSSATGTTTTTTTATSLARHRTGSGGSGALTYGGAGAGSRMWFWRTELLADRISEGLNCLDADQLLELMKERMAKKEKKEKEKEKEKEKSNSTNNINEDVHHQDKKKNETTTTTVPLPGQEEEITNDDNNLNNDNNTTTNEMKQQRQKRTQQHLFNQSPSRTSVLNSSSSSSSAKRNRNSPEKLHEHDQKNDDDKKHHQQQHQQHQQLKLPPAMQGINDWVDALFVFRRIAYDLLLLECVHQH